MNKQYAFDVKRHATDLLSVVETAKTLLDDPVEFARYKATLRGELRRFCRTFDSNYVGTNVVPAVGAGVAYHLATDILAQLAGGLGE